MQLIYKYENETKMQMVKKYKGRRNWMNINVYRNADEGERNKDDNGKWGTLSVTVNTQCEQRSINMQRSS